MSFNSTGRTFLATDNYLYRLNVQLVQEERVDLGANVIHQGLALSSTGMVVVCLQDLSCSVYNASNLSAGPIRSISNAIGEDIGFGATIITSGDTFYTGAMTDEGQKMVLQQFGEGFNRSSDNNPAGTRNKLVGISGLTRRDYHDGFVSGGFAYYFVVDYYQQPRMLISLCPRLLRICNMPDCGGPSTCGVTALYELEINCDRQSVFALVSSLQEDFSGMSGPTAVITLATTAISSVYLINITAVNEAMDAKYESCILSRTAEEEIGLAWRTGSSKNCSSLPQVCNIKCIS